MTDPKSIAQKILKKIFLTTKKRFFASSLHTEQKIPVLLKEGRGFFRAVYSAHY